MLDRLVGGAVLSHAHRVVAPREHHLGFRQRGEPHCGPHVVGEHQEGAHHRYGAAVQGHAVGDRPHGVLAHAEVDLPASWPAGREHPGVGDGGAGVAREVGTPAGESGHHRQQGLQGGIGGLAGGDRLARLERRQRVVPAGTAGCGQARLEVGAVAVEGRGAGLPGEALVLAGGPGAAVVVEHLGRHVERIAGGQSHQGLGGRDLLVEDGVAVCGRRARSPGSRRGDHGAHDHKGRAIVGAGRVAQSGFQRVEVLGRLAEFDDMPAVGPEAGRGVVGEGQVGAAVDGDLVVVVDHHQPTQAQMSRQRGGLVADTLGQVAVAGDHEDAVVADIGAVAASHLALRDGHAHRVGDALTERAGGHLHPRRAADLGMAGRGRPPLPEVPQILEGQAVTGQVEHGVLQD